MKPFAIVLGAVLTLVPSIRFLADLRSAQQPAGDAGPANLAKLDEALRGNPASPYRWCDLGEALLAAGRIDEARYCFTRATQLGPQSPPVFWRTSQFYTQINDTTRSQEHLGKMLALVPEYHELVFGLYMGGPKGPLDAFDRGIPPGSPLAQDYFRFLLRNNAALKDVDKAWAWLQSHSLGTIDLAGDYVDFLLSKREYSAATESWKRSAGSRDASYLNPNLLFNGSFETDPLPNGLDWRFIANPNVQMNRDSTVAHSGAASFLIQFNGQENEDFHALTHDVIVQPGRYHLKAWIRTADLTTDQEIGFRFVDASGPSGRMLFEAIKAMGNHDWMPFEADVTVNAAQLLRIEVVRKPSWKFDNKIKGKIWIDAVSLVRS